VTDITAMRREWLRGTRLERREHRRMVLHITIHRGGE
jgi:hypothetical protein